jgi:hypothetical protein
MEEAKKHRDNSYLLSSNEVELIELCREVCYGKIVVHLENSEPTWVESISRNYKFGLVKTK